MQKYNNDKNCKLDIWFKLYLFISMNMTILLSTILLPNYYLNIVKLEHQKLCMNLLMDLLII